MNWLSHQRTITAPRWMWLLAWLGIMLIPLVQIAQWIA